MALNDYDVGLAFARIEDELIASMMRNLKRHLKEEADEEFDWSQWQVEQLKYLNEYRRRNKKKYGPQFKDINRKMVEAIREAEEQGQKAEELRILQAITENKKIQRRYANRKPSIEAQGDAFFRVNDKKLEALADATQNDMQKAEQAVLRRANDQYRQIIFDAQVYANTGAATVEKAVDMATKDFLSRGIDSIVYKNGSRHTISDYADMYIRTAERRATLMGEGRKRQEWGESLVIVNKRGTMRDGDHGSACPLCIPWLGKVLVDDVYSGGKPDGRHKLLSQAMAEGFLHPRCKDSVTTYIPGISSAPDPDATKKELKAAAEAEKEEARENYVDRQAEKYERLTENSLDKENQKIYEARRREWRERQIGRKEENEKSLISGINQEGTDSLLEAYDRRREQYGLNLVPADQLRSNPLNNVTVDYTGVSVETAEAFNTTISELSEEYLSGITQVRVANPKESFGASFFAKVEANDSIGQRTLLINPHKCKDSERMAERIRALSDAGKCVKIPVGKEREYVATHEFAHGLLNMGEGGKSLVEMDWKKTRGARKEIQAMYKEYMDEIHGIEAEIDELRKSPAFTDFSADPAEQMEAFRKLKEARERLKSIRISEYSMENADEFMAEAFTQNRIGTGQSKYTDRVMEVLDHEYKIGTTQRKEVGHITQYSSSRDKKKDRIRIVRHSLQDWPEDIVTTDTWKDGARVIFDYDDITEEFIKDKLPINDPVGEIVDFVQDGKRYTVDNINVCLDPDEKERRTAAVIQRKLGLRVSLMPKVTGVYKRVQVPDYLVEGERWDRKGVEGDSKQYLYNTIHKKKKQAETFVFCMTTKTKLSVEEVAKQAEDAFHSSHLSFVKRIVIIDENEEVVKVLQRKK